MEKPIIKAENVGQLISIKVAAESTPYSATFLRELARTGKINAVKINRDWLTTHEAVLEYVKRQQHYYEGMLKALKNCERSLS